MKKPSRSISLSSDLDIKLTEASEQAGINRSAYISRKMSLILEDGNAIINLENLESMLLSLHGDVAESIMLDIYKYQVIA